ncbi:MAG: hypothetical protein M1814_000808 [Vezdaea aestivalis]|nr:MAG: hypothetical protein M1814_000808 [Vezdaea aestivalis]
MVPDEEVTIKILLVGPSGVGKSALLIRYCDDLFDSESSTATIGVDFKVKKVAVRGKTYRLNLLDTAGQERFRTLSNSYYRGAHGAILVYDVSSKESFLSMGKWIDEVKGNTMPGTVLYLVGSKTDRGSLRTVKYTEGEALAARHGLSFCEVSSKTKDNVRKPFVDLVDQIVNSPNIVLSPDSRSNLLHVTDNSAASQCSC